MAGSCEVDSDLLPLLTVNQLQSIARSRNVKVKRSLKKEQILEALVPAELLTAIVDGAVREDSESDADMAIDEEMV